MEKIFAGKKFPVNHKIVWGPREVFFCYHCEQPFLSTGEMPEDFRCPRCGCPHFQTLEEKIREERDLDEFRERAKDLDENVARKVATLESIRHIPH